MSTTPNYEAVVAGTVQKVIGKKTDVKLFNSLYEDLMDNYQVRYHRQDDFTVALLIDKNSPADYDDHVYVGVSKRNPIDRASPLRGRALALSRAVRRMVESRLAGEKEETTSATDNVKHTRERTRPTSLTTSYGRRVLLQDKEDTNLPTLVP